MSEQRHTPEPWKLRRDEQYPSVVFLEGDGYCVSGDVMEPDAARIVSCVNALAGVKDPAEAIDKAKAAINRILRDGIVTAANSFELCAALAALTPEPKTEEKTQ